MKKQIQNVQILKLAASNETTQDKIQDSILKDSKKRQGVVINERLNKDVEEPNMFTHTCLSGGLTSD